jgi:hypothetical protein
MVRTTRLPYLPDLHSQAEDLAFFRDRVFRDGAVQVASEAVIEGFCAWRSGWVDHLYIRPDCHGRGRGTALLAQAMTRYSPLRLWAFQRNTQALRFYAARGFREVERTDGGRNEEGEPDALLEWVRPSRVFHSCRASRRASNQPGMAETGAPGSMISQPSGWPLTIRSIPIPNIMPPIRQPDTLEATPSQTISERSIMATPATVRPPV